MPAQNTFDRNSWRKASELRKAYKAKLLAKGIIDGSSKMNSLMSRKKF